MTTQELLWLRYVLTAMRAGHNMFHEYHKAIEIIEREIQIKTTDYIKMERHDDPK